MKLHELKSILAAQPEKFPRFVLPGGNVVPAHFHVTEVGHVQKNFIDCGGTIRKNDAAVLQLWVNGRDPDHRLDAGKLASILSLGDRVLPHSDLDVEVEWDCCVTAQYPIESHQTIDSHTEFTLTSKQTDCLAREQCGVGEDACCNSEPTACC